MTTCAPSTEPPTDPRAVTPAPANGSLDRAHPQRPRDAGLAALELVVLFPVLLLLIFGVMQGALYYHARGVASAAASEGVMVARTETGTTGAARTAASTLIAQAGGDRILDSTTVTATRSATQAEVTVTGTAPNLLLGLPPLPIRQSAAAPVERFTS